MRPFEPAAHPDCTQKRCACACDAGTGSLRVGAEFLSNFYASQTIYVCQPTWGNHNKIFPKGGLTIKPYRYYDPKTQGLDFEGMKEDMGRAERGAIVLLHACAHNPTGVDPTQSQWHEILDICKRQEFLCFFDSAYQVRAVVTVVTCASVASCGDQCVVMCCVHSAAIAGCLHVP